VTVTTATTYVPARFGDPTTLTTTPINVYTFDEVSILKQLLVANIFNGLLTFSLYLVPSGEVLREKYKIFGDVQVDANTVLTIDLNQVVYSGETIYASANVANGLNFILSGVKIYNPPTVV
jgi:hypothetical protein